MNRVFISGVSDGIGLALATLYLEKGWTVFGIARSQPDDLINHENFIFRYCDLQHLDKISDVFNEEFTSLLALGVSTVHLNAGMTGNVPARAETYTLTDIQHTLAVNTLANKVLLDIFLGLPNKPKVIVASASIAGVRFRAGMLPYSLSKAGLAAMCGVYAQEYPEVFFAVLGMCNVDTKLSREIVFSPRVSDFPDHMLLQQRFAAPNYVVSPAERAEDVFNIIHIQESVQFNSGEFTDIRNLLSSTNNEKSELVGY